MKSDRLLDIITDLEKFSAELRVDGQLPYSDRVGKVVEELYWLFKDLSEFE
jgi:hypothetical protein